jgi:sialate O-acetylesterase
MKRVVYLLVLCLSVGITANGKVRLPNLVSDGIVFQRNAPICVWGWAEPRERVTVTFLGEEYKTRADKNGSWKIMLPAQTAGGPYTMVVNDQTVSNILIGEVWLLSGQSNMETPMERVAEMFSEEVASIDNPLIHHFKTELRFNVEGAEKDLQGHWKEATPDNIMGFSATAYFFGKYLYEHFGVPIGLFNSSVGGSPIEAWLSPEATKTFPDLARQLVQLTDRQLQDSLQNAMREAFAGRNRSMTVDAGAGKWQRADWDDSDWEHIYLPGYFGEKGVDFHNGVVWLRKTIELPASWKGKAAVLRMGTMVDSDSTFVNGQFVGTTGYQYPPRKYVVPAGVLKAGKNVIAVRLTANARGGLVEEKPYYLRVEDESYDLTGDWKYRVGHDTAPRFAGSPRGEGNWQMPPIPSQNSPTALYNAMIEPARNYVFKGVVWYQGESNAGQANYGERFTALVDTWRTTFANPTLPVVYVQLPNYMKPERYQEHSGWARTRDIQRRSLTLPDVGMVVTLGLGEWNDIHPLNKRDLGYRLALQARRVAYGQTGFVSRSPLPVCVEAGGAGDLIVTFDNDGSELFANLRLRGFVVAGSDGKYHEAEATPITFNRVRVWSRAVPEPVSVRYAWADNPLDANLINTEGMPVGTFQEALSSGE